MVNGHGAVWRLCIWVLDCYVGSMTMLLAGKKLPSSVNDKLHGKQMLNPMSVEKIHIHIPIRVCVGIPKEFNDIADNRGYLAASVAFKAL